MSYRRTPTRVIRCALCGAPRRTHHPRARCCSRGCALALSALKRALLAIRPRPARDEWGAMAIRAAREVWRETL